MTQRRPNDAFGDIPDLVPDLVPAPRPPPAAAPSGGPVLPPIQAPQAAPSEPPGPIDFGAAFDLDVPRPGGVPQFAPAPAAPAPQGQGASFGGAIPTAPVSQPAAAPVPMAPPSGSGLQSQAAQAPPLAPTAYSAPPSYQSSTGEEAGPQRAPLITREQLQDAAKRAADVGREVAGKTRDAAMSVALRSVGHNGEKSIRLEDPSTWLKPMLGPIIAIAAALVFTIIAVVAGVAWLRYVAILCIVAAIGFGVARWIKLQADS